MMSIKLTSSPTLHTICATILIQLLALQLIRCQITDGDDQFEAVHQDIGRISGLSSQGSPQVAPKSALVARQQQQYNNDQSQMVSPPAATAQLSPSTVAQVFDRSPARASSTRQASSVGSSSRKANRITLVARRDPLPSASAAKTSATPPQVSLVAAQLPAPPQQTVAPPLDQPDGYTTSFFSPTLPAAAASRPAIDQQQQQLGGGGVSASPAFSSFRSSVGGAAMGHTNSVSARHSALMAQVAAERAAAASLIGINEPPLQVAGASFNPAGTAPEALSSPAGQSAAAAAAAIGHQAQSSQTVSSFAQAAPQQQQQQLSQSDHQHQHLAAPTSAQGQVVSLGQAEEHQAAPSFEHVLGNGCPHKGVFSWENKDHCDRYYMCTNGTFTEEACPNGLAYSQQGAVYQHCAYNWNVNCGSKKTAEPIASPGCPWQFGIFPIVQNGRCSIDYFACEWGVPETKRCTPEGLFYDDRIKGCQWADQLGCKSETLLNFKCPPEDEDNPYWPYPRYYHDNKDVIVCVNEQPRLVHCNEEQKVDPSSLACIDIEKRKKKF